MHPPRILVLVAVLGVLVAGCTPAQAPSPSPVPTVPTCVPEFGGTPFPCTQADYEQFLRTQARYAEAERVFRAFNHLYAQESVDRRAEPSQELLELTAGEFRTHLPEIRQKSLQIADFSGQIEVVSMKPSPWRSGDLGSLAMIVCSDRSGWTVNFKDGTSGSEEVITADRVQFDEVAGTRIVDLAFGEESECA